MQHDHFGAFVPLAWGLMWFIFWALIIFQARRERSRLYDMVEKIMSDGKPLPPELTELLRRRAGRGGPASDLRTGLILIAVAAGLALSGAINFFQDRAFHPDAVMFHGPFALFPIPGLIGVAFLIVGYLRRKDVAGL